jgi:trehalose-phosphatase
MTGAPRPLFANLPEFEQRRAGRAVFLFLDFDGTLASIVSDPAQARMSAGMREAMVQVAARMPVAVVSGRDLSDVAERVGMSALYYAGSHGLDISGPDARFEHPAGLAALPELDAAEGALRAAVAGVPGALVERKHFTLAVHYRMAPRELVAQVEQSVQAELLRRVGLRLARGKQVLELRPQIEWNKGSAVDWILGALAGLDARATLPIYIGDDVTDEDAFVTLSGRGIGIWVAEGETVPPPGSAALFWLRGTEEVERLLRHLAT